MRERFKFFLVSGAISYLQDTLVVTNTGVLWQAKLNEREEGWDFFIKESERERLSEREGERKKEGE